MNTNYHIPHNLYTTLLEGKIKGRLYFFAAILVVAVLVAIGQSNQFASSLWVITEFGFNYWAKYIHRMFDNFYWWAIVSGILAAAGAFIGSTTTDLKKIVLGMSVSFGIGFAFTYLLVSIVTVFLYIPLGIFSFVFPDQIHFLSIGFAFLCAAYIVFTIIAIDIPPFLLEIIRKAPLYYKMLATLFGLLLVSKSLSMIISILQILMEYSIWRVHLAAFILVFGATLLLSVLINLKFFRYETKYEKIAIIAGVYILSIITGNISEAIFHWGEYGAAVVTTFLAPITFSFLLHKIRKDIVSVVSFVSGCICGFGIGLFFAIYTGLRIIGQGWFGVTCGTTIALGFGISFGFMLAPRISELATKIFRFNPIIGFFAGIGFFVGSVLGVVVIGFVNRSV